MQRYLITGATGFVGRALVSELIGLGADLTLAGRNCEQLHRLYPQARAVEFDLDHPQMSPEVLANVDCVLHLAARVHVMQPTAADDEAFTKANAIATAALAQMAADQGVRRFVYLSSIKVNGESTSDRPFAYSDRSAPLDAYGRSKAAAEEALARVAERSAMDCVSVRPPLVYGPGVGANFVRLLRLVDTNMPLPFGGVHNSRSLIGLRNLTSFIRYVAAFAPPARGTWLVSDGEDWSTAELCKLIARTMGRRARLVNVPLALLKSGALLVGKGAELSRLTGSLQVDITHTREALGWTPPVTSEQEIARTVSWFLETQRAA